MTPTRLAGCTKLLTENGALASSWKAGLSNLFAQKCFLTVQQPAASEMHPSFIVYMFTTV